MSVGLLMRASQAGVSGPGRGECSRRFARDGAPDSTDPAPRYIDHGDALADELRANDCELRGELALRPLSSRGQDEQMKDFCRKPGTVTRTLRVLNVNLPLVFREV